MVLLEEIDKFLFIVLCFFYTNCIQRDWCLMRFVSERNRRRSNIIDDEIILLLNNLL